MLMKFAIAFLIVLMCIVGCGKSGVSRPQTDNNVGADDAVSSPPAIPANAPIIPNGNVTVRELYVTNSVPVLPGSPVAIVDSSSPTLLVAKVVPSNVRWKVPAPFVAPKYPASGFVTFSLSKSEWDAIRAASNVSIQPSDDSP
jgi:hypothetical protein